VKKAAETADYERNKLLIIPWSLVRIQAGPVLQINDLDFY